MTESLLKRMLRAGVKPSSNIEDRIQPKHPNRQNFSQTDRDAEDIFGSYKDLFDMHGEIVGRTEDFSTHPDFPKHPQGIPQPPRQEDYIQDDPNTIGKDVSPQWMKDYKAYRNQYPEYLDYINELEDVTGYGGRFHHQPSFEFNASRKAGEFEETYPELIEKLIKETGMSRIDLLGEFIKSLETPEGASAWEGFEATDDTNLIETLIRELSKRRPEAEPEPYLGF